MNDFAAHIVEISNTHRELSDVGADMDPRHARRVAELFAKVRDEAASGYALAQQLAEAHETHMRRLVILGQGAGIA
jgi:hypothetical protein